MTLGTLLPPPRIRNSQLLPRKTSQSTIHGMKNFEHAIDAFCFAHGSPMTRFRILQKAMRETKSLSEILIWLNFGTVNTISRRNVPPYSTVYSPRLIRSTINLTRNEAAYLWSKYVPDPIAKVIADNFYWRSWMTGARTNWNMPAMMRLCIFSAIRSIGGILNSGSCVDIHVLEFLTAVLNVQSGVASKWVRKQISFLDVNTLKESSDTYRWKPFYHRVSIAFLRLAASVIEKQSISHRCLECETFSKKQLTDQQKSWMHPSIIANVIAQAPPPQFLPTLAVIEQRFALSISEDIMYAYLSCWALTEVDFAAIINGINHNLCLEECIMHAHQLYMMYKRCVTVSNTRFQHDASYYALMIEVCYIVGAVAEAWKIYKREKLHAELPTHTLYVLLDLRNHLPTAEKFIPVKEYVEFVQAVYNRVTDSAKSTLLTPPEILLCTKLCAEMTSHRETFLAKDSSIVSNLLDVFDKRLILQIQTDIHDTRQSYLPVEEIVVGFIESVHEFVLTQQSDALCARMISIMQQKGACASALPAAMLLETALKAGYNKQACTFYLGLKPSIRSIIVNNLKFKLLDMLFLVLQAESHGAEANLLKSTLQIRRKAKPSHEQMHEIHANSASKEPYHIELNFKQLLPTGDIDAMKKREKSKYHVVYW